MTESSHPVEVVTRLVLDDQHFGPPFAHELPLNRNRESELLALHLLRVASAKDLLRAVMPVSLRWGWRPRNRVAISFDKVYAVLVSAPLEPLHEFFRNSFRFGNLLWRHLDCLLNELLPECGDIDEFNADLDVGSRD